MMSAEDRKKVKVRLGGGGKSDGGGGEDLSNHSECRWGKKGGVNGDSGFLFES